MSQILESIQTAQHGTSRNFRCILYKNGDLSGQKDFATRQLAWAYGINWENINPEHLYRIVHQDRLDELYDKANSLYRQFLWNGRLTDLQEKELADLRQEYLLESGGVQMPELQYVELR